MLCKGCGLEQKDNQLFCSHCGMRNEMAGETAPIKKCTHCGKEFYKEQRFCDACGGSLTDIQKETVPMPSPLPTPIYQQAPNPIPQSQVVPNPLPTPVKQQEPNSVPYNQTSPNPLPPPTMQANQLPAHQTPANQIPMGQLPPGQLQPGQMPPGQMPPGQMPGQIPPGQMPRGQMPQGQIPQSQMPPGQIPQGQLPPGQILPGQMPPGQFPQGQMPSRQMSPGQMPPKPMPQGQMPTGQMPPGQLQPGHMPPPAPSQMPAQEAGGGKKNKALVVVIIAAAAVIFLGIGVFGAVKLISFLKDRKADLETYTIDDYYDDVVGEYDEYSNSKDNSEDLDEDIIEEDPVDSTGENDDLVAEPEVVTYDVKYSYTELPDATSLDSDYRFIQMDYYTYDGISTYRYWYNVQSTTLEDFYAAVDNYCVYLQTWNGYFYEEEFSLDQYQQLGSLTTYMSKEDMAIAVTAYTEADTYYVDVEIYNLSAPEENVSTETYVNIDYYLSGREFTAFDQYTEVFTESGIAFRVNDVSVSDLGNDFVSIDINMDLAATYTGLTSAYDDFLLLPMDSDGNILADASLISYMYDINGYDTFPPFTLDTEYYDNYTMSFVVPSQTQYFTIYCTNLLDGSSMGPAYYVDMEIY